MHYLGLCMCSSANSSVLLMPAIYAGDGALIVQVKARSARSLHVDKDR